MHLPRPSLLIFVNALVLLAVFMLMAQSLVLVKRLVKADQITGNIEVQTAGRGAWKAISDATLLRSGDAVRSGEDSSAVFKWADGTCWKMMPQTELTLKESTYHSMRKSEQSRLYLSSGKVFLRVTKAVRPDADFEVETPGGSVIVRGTILSVEVRDGATEVAVFKGNAQLLCEGRKRIEEIRAGEVALLDLSGNFSEKKEDDRTHEFMEYQTIVQPRLRASIKPMRKGSYIISGSTESGSDLTINDEEVLVLGNGSFMLRAAARENKVFTITSTDRYGAKNTQVLQAPQP